MALPLPAQNQTPAPAPAPARYLPSPQQAAIIKAAAELRPGGALTVNAKAGTGKTSTIFMLLESAGPGSHALVAYNRDIVAELRERAGKLPRKPGTLIRVKTAHAWGLTALLAAQPGLTLQESKGRELCQRLNIPELFWEFATAAYKLARGAGFGLPGTPAIDGEMSEAWANLIEHYGLEEKLWGTGKTVNQEEVPGLDIGQRDTILAQGVRYASKLLYWGYRWLEKSDGVYDYEDMIWGPVACGLQIEKHDRVYVDECQDLSMSRIRLIQAMAKPSGSWVFVGDPCQAINGFAGADASSFEKINQTFKARVLPLTVTYRNTHSIVHFAKSYLLPGEEFSAHEGNPDGTPPQVLEHQKFINRIKELEPGRDMVICRNNAWLVSLWFEGLRAGVKMRIKGGAELGKELAALASKWKGITTARQLGARLDTWLEKRLAMAEKTKNPGMAEKSQNQYDTLKAVIAGCGAGATVVDVLDMLDTVCGSREDVPVVELATIHKSKGMERERIWWLGPELLPSPYARKPWQQEQERFLSFVAATRAKRDLMLVNLPRKKK